MKIKKFHNKYTEDVADIIFHTYKKFNKNEHTKKESFIKYLNFYDKKKQTKDTLIEKFKKTPIFFVAEMNNKIVGIIRGYPDRIINLFVRGEHHKKGIGKKLIERFETEVKKMKNKEIKVRSSLHAIKFYEKMGYKKTTGLRIFKGLKHNPMKKIFKK